MVLMLLSMLLLAQEKYAKNARFGFVNGAEPVNYVRDIRQRFEAYVELSRQVAGVQPDSGASRGLTLVSN